MNNIIKFKNYNRIKGDTVKNNFFTDKLVPDAPICGSPEAWRITMELKELLKYLKNKNQTEEEYSLREIRNITNDILSMSFNYSGRCATPIVKIAKLFDFKIYKESLNESGDININGETRKKYGHDKVILVNRDEELFHQRFVVAHELAHYLFDYLGNAKYRDKDILFADTYQKDRHETPQEKRANTFAAEIMMPKELFIKQYNVAKVTDSNHMFIVMYLSRYFETSIESIERRIMEVSR